MKTGNKLYEDVKAFVKSNTNCSEAEAGSAAAKICYSMNTLKNVGGAMASRDGVMCSLSIAGVGLGAAHGNLPVVAVSGVAAAKFCKSVIDQVGLHIPLPVVERFMHDQYGK